MVSVCVYVCVCVCVCNSAGVIATHNVIVLQVFYVLFSTGYILQFGEYITHEGTYVRNSIATNCLARKICYMVY